MSKERIGFVGVGLMGHGMAKNLLGAGYGVMVVAHRNRGPVDDLIGRGASEAKSLADLASQSDVIHICAPGSPEVEAIVDAMKPGLHEGSVIIDCSTSDPASTLALSADLADLGCAIADAPLGGTPVQAEAGELGAMVGADDAVFERIKPIIACWAQNCVHLGPVGLGHKMKLLNNFLSLGYAAIYSEALALGEKAGVGVEQFDSVIRGSRLDCGFYQTFMGYALEGNRESHKFTLTNAYKDMRYLAKLADEMSIANPVGNAIKNSLASSVNAGGNGPEDYVPHLVDFVRAQNGVKDQ